MSSLGQTLSRSGLTVDVMPSRSRVKLLVALGLVGAAVVAGVIAWMFMPGLVGSGEDGQTRQVQVRRGPLTVIVTADGTVRSDRTVDVKSEVRGLNRILDIVPESTRITEAGKFLCQLDTSSLESQRDSQVIKVKQAEAAATQAERELEIQLAQNESEIRRAAQALEFARMDLDKFVRGDKGQEEQAAENAIIIANEELKRAEDKFKWSTELHKNGYISDSELRADELAVTKSRLDVALAETRKRVLIEHAHKKSMTRLTSDVVEAEAELKRTQDRAVARESRARTDLETRQESYRLEQDNLNKLDSQIAAGTIVAPQPGLVVYASTVRPPRWGNQQPIDVGYQVRENESIISLPDLSVMVADLTVPEAKRTQISDGQSVTIRVEAQPEHPLRGAVKSRGLMPAQQDWFRRGDVQQFQVVVEIYDPPEWLLPGLRCSADIMVAELDDVVVVPMAAVFSREATRFCYVVDAGRIRAVPVLIGLDDDKMVEIKAGLKPGWQVLLAEPERPGDIPLESPTFVPPQPQPPATQPHQPTGRELTPEQIREAIERIRQRDPDRASELEQMSLEEQREAIERLRARRPRPGGTNGDAGAGDRTRRRVRPSDESGQ